MLSIDDLAAPTARDQSIEAALPEWIKATSSDFANPPVTTVKYEPVEKAAKAGV